ncbi:MAG TPA: RDD family protein, partial [Solirubrobacteraceae bacterium]|nr:RDD family protein [Solirubrobacteraceae bacterium]
MSPVGDDERAAGDHGKASGPRAGFWIRFGGSIVDGILLGVIEVVLRLVFKGAGSVLSLVVSGVYFTVLVGSARGQTLGMRAVGIRVISFDGSGSIGYGRALIRWVGGYISAVVILLGFLWMLWDKEKQCWHD